MPARTPRGVAAITESGDVVLIDLDSLTTRTIASYPPSEAADPDVPVSSFLTDIAVLADGRILLSSCCEPAAGQIRVLGERGNHFKVMRILDGDDPEIDPSGRRVAMAFLQSLGISPASLRRGSGTTISGSGRFSPDDPGWSPDGNQLMFSLVHRLGFVDVTARALREARYLRPREGTYWGSTAYLRRGPLAVELEGMWGRGVRGPSRILEIHLATGRRRVFLKSPGGITDLATDRAGKALLWVDDGTIHWRVLGEQGALAGGFVKAAFFPG